jgi:hypothetical protein
MVIFKTFPDFIRDITEFLELFFIIPKVFQTVGTPTEKGY